MQHLHFFITCVFFLSLSSVTIKITTEAYGYEISWRLEHKTEAKRADNECSGRGYGSYNSGSDMKTCELEDAGYKLICEDSWGDGWHGGYLTIGGIDYCKNFRYNFPNMCTYEWQPGCNTIMTPIPITIAGVIFFSYIILNHY